MAADGGRLGLAVKALIALLAASPVGLFVSNAEAASGPGGGSSCPAVNGIPANLGQVVEYRGSLSCYHPGGRSFRTLGSPSRQSPAPTQNAKKGGDCDVLDIFSVDFSAMLPGWGNFVGGWLLYTADGRTTGLDDKGSARSGTFDAFEHRVSHGQWMPDQSGQLYCETDPAKIPRGSVTYSYPCPPDDPVNCLWWVGHSITPASSPADWAPYVANVSGWLKGEAGTVQAAPTAKTTVGQFATCFWIDGVGVPVERDLQVVLAGAPDASGRSIFYTLLMKLKFMGVGWQFDDASANNDPEQNPEDTCGIHPFVAAHRYRQLSEGKPDNKSHVTATETYQIEADLYWLDSGGPKERSLTSSIPAQVITPTSHAVMVGQIEGVPTS